MLEDLSNHPDGAKPENRATLEATKKALPKALAKLELLKPRIVQRCEDYEKQSKEREERRAAAMQAKSLQGTRPRYTGRRSSTRRESDPVLAGDAKPLAASENKDLAVKIAHGEIKRRETARRAIRQAGVSADEEHERRIAGLWGDWEEEFVRDGGFSGEDDLQRRMKETRLSMKSDVSLRSKFSTRKLPSQATLDYRYPSILKREEPSYEPGVPPPFAQSISLQTPAKDIPIPRSPPSPPPKSWDHAEASLSGELQEVVPPRPAKAPLASSAAPVPPARPSSDGNTSGDLQPSSFVFKPSAFLENGTPLRTIFLPPDLRSAFLSIAAANTKANLETCGILCGTLISNALFISRLVIPEQKSTSDTCETVNESALFDYCDAEDLMVLGWIHTHPTQRCFMSSRDLHTHCGYQVMMPENIAIVCAPNQTPSYVSSLLQSTTLAACVLTMILPDGAFSASRTHRA